MPTVGPSGSLEPAGVGLAGSETSIVRRPRLAVGQVGHAAEHLHGPGRGERGYAAERGGAGGVGDIDEPEAAGAVGEVGGVPST
jgi:hypothetical protein